MTPLNRKHQMVIGRGVTQSHLLFRRAVLGRKEGENMTKAPSRVCCNTPQIGGGMGLDQASDKENGK